MKISVKNIFFAAGASALLASCGENSWNDHLDGFEPGANYNKAIEGAFTMSETDYTAVAGNADNKALAEAAGLDKALKAVGTNGYFSAEIPAKEYMPAFLASSSAPYFLAPDGSKVNVTYNESGETDPVIAQVAAATKYTVSKADYQTAWGSDINYIEAFAPMTAASASLPTILKNGIADATDGQLAIVKYNQSSENPLFLGETAGPINYSNTFTEGKGDFEIYNVTLPSELSFVWSEAGSYGMKASAFANSVNYATEAWLLSPVFNLTGTTASFSFEQATNFFTDLDVAKQEASVWVRVIGGNWEQITDYTFPSKLSWTYVATGDIDLSKYCGQAIQIGFKYTSGTKAGTWEVKNFVLSADEGTVEDNPGFKAKAMKAPAATPATSGMTAVYRYDGSKWAPAADIMALNDADYAALGVAVNKLQDPKINLPLYMKANKPYAVEGDQVAVVYNGSSCSVLVYDGQNWTVNDNDFQTKTGQFVKKGGVWSFVKYIGKAYFTYTTELVLDTQYLIVAEGACANPISTSKGYDYFYTSPVTIVDGVIEQKTEANAFTFASSVTIDDKTYKLEEGQFMIIDSNGRYCYNKSGFNNFNFAAQPTITDGAIDPGFAYTAKCNEEGLWTITNVSVGNWIQYSIKYVSYGCYPTEQSPAVLPSLYRIVAE